MYGGCLLCRLYLLLMRTDQSHQSRLHLGVLDILRFSRPSIVHFTVTSGNEAGVDLVLTQPFQLHYANCIIVMLNGIF